MEKMMKKLGLLLLFLAAAEAAAGAPGSCVGRCGEVFTRGQQCNCDFSCMQHNECCPDFQAACTTTPSCQGRCGETFRRGLVCECDPMCVQLNTCCQDFQLHCEAAVTVPSHGRPQPQRATVPRNRNPDRNREKSNSESEEWYTGKGRRHQHPGGRYSGRFGHTNPLPAGSLGSFLPAGPGGRNIPNVLLPRQVSSSPAGTHPFPAVLSQLGNGAPVLDGTVPVSSSINGGADGRPNVQPVLTPESLGASGPHTGPFGSRPSTRLDVTCLGLSADQRRPAGSGTGLTPDVNLCSETPFNGLTALSNGTVLIFKGELFWTVDSVRGTIGPPQNITEILGVPSPIDTVFTQINCNGYTYIIKGDQCWRLNENLLVEPGYPKPLTSEFPGLTGSVSAALVVPANRNTPETIYFFKTGDIMQRFTFVPSSTASCRDTPRSNIQKNAAQQAEILLSGEININVSLTGFPTPITSALSMPVPQSTNTYQHFVFSGPLYFRVQITGDLPVLAKPDLPATLAPLPVPILSPLILGTNSDNLAGRSQNRPHPTNSIRFWLRCP